MREKDGRDRRIQGSGGCGSQGAGGSAGTEIPGTVCTACAGETAEMLAAGHHKGGASGKPGSRMSWMMRPQALFTWLAGAFLTAAWFLSRWSVDGWPVLLYALAILTGGFFVGRQALRSLRHGRLDIHVLLVLAVIGAVWLGQWFEGALVVFLFSVGELLEAWSHHRTNRSLQELLDLRPPRVTVRRGGVLQEIPAEQARPGEIFIVRPGSRIPLDGQVVKGESAVNQAPITGESLPVAKGPGDHVFAGTLNGSGYLEVRSSRPSRDTTLSRLIRLVQEAQAQRAPAERFIDRLARYYTPAIFVLGIGVAVLPPLLAQAPWDTWIYRGLAVWLVACPCALVISTPAAVVSGLGNAARHGILIKGGAHLESLARVDTVAFDKTGTLTEGHPRVADVIPAPGFSAAEVLQTAAQLEARSQHPLAAAILAAAGAPAPTWPEVRFFQQVSGNGLRGQIGSHQVFVGEPGWVWDQAECLRALSKSVPTLQEAARRLQNEGKTVMAVARRGSGEGGEGGEPVGLVAVVDALRAESLDVVAELRRSGIRHVVLLTGDHPAAARAVAARLGVTQVEAGLLPEQKLEAVRRLQRAQRRVAMVGDGINDAPALAAAQVGIAIGAAGNDTAMETAQAVLMGADLHKLPYALSLSRATLRVVRQNVAFALLSKLAALLLIFPGWLTLWMAVLVDSGATVLVTLNGLRLFWHRPAATVSSAAGLAGPSLGVPGPEAVQRAGIGSRI